MTGLGPDVPVGTGLPRRRLDPLATTAISLAATTVVNSALGVAFWVVASRLYPEQQLGEGAALISAMMLLSIVAQLNLSSGIPRLLPQVRDRRWRPVAGAYALTGALAAVVTGVFVVAAPRLAGGFAFLGTSVALQLLLIAAVAGWNVFALQDAVLTATRWGPAVPVENAIFGLLKIGLIVWAAGRFGGRGIFVGWALAMAVMLLPVNTLVFGKVLRTPIGAAPAQAAASALPISDRRRVARFLGVDYAAALLSQGYNALLPLLVVAILGRVANAYFYIAFLIASAIAALAQALSTSLVVEGAHDERLLPGLAARSLARYLLVVVPGVLVLIAGASIVLLPFGRAYVDNSTALLRLLLLGTVPQGIVTIYLGVERVRARVARVLAVEAAVVVLVTTGAIFGMPRLGVTGVGLAWLAAQTVVAVVVAPRLVRVVYAGVSFAIPPVMRRAVRRASIRARDNAHTLDEPPHGPWNEASVDVAAAAVTVGLLFMVGLGISGPLRTLLALGFVTFVPGWALLGHVRLAAGLPRVALSVAFSLTIATAVPTILLWVRVWHPLVAFSAVAALSLIALVVNLARSHVVRDLRTWSLRA